MAQWKKLQRRLASKWQIPTFLISMGLLGVALFSARRTIDDIPLTETLAYMDRLTASGAYDLVFRNGQYVLSVADKYSERELAEVTLRLSRARHDYAVAERARTRDAAREVVAGYEMAKIHSLPLTGEDHARWGRALLWLGQGADASPHLETALNEGAKNPHALRRRFFWLRESLGDDEDALLAIVRTYLSEIPQDSLVERLWGIEQEIELLADQSLTDLAATTLVRERDLFAGTAFEDDLAYLGALLLYRQGFHEDAETSLRAIRNRVDPTADVAGKAGWLLGQVMMRDDGPRNPYDAISFFRDVLDVHPFLPHGLACHLGIAEANAMLEQHDQALSSYADAIDALPEIQNRRLLNPDIIRASLGIRAQEQRDLGNFNSSLSYVTLALSLVEPARVDQQVALLQQRIEIEELLGDQLLDVASGQERSQAAETRQLAYAHFLSASDDALTVARETVWDEELSASASWQAAELRAKGQDRVEAANLFDKYRYARPDDARVPRALFRIGQLKQSAGDLEGAIEAYRVCFEEHKRTIDGLRALIPLAQCFMALGRESDSQVEATLDIILEQSEAFTPDAPEFKDALFLYGEVLTRRNAFELAIGRLEEALQRYPDDERVWSARGLLADCYRRSALALKRDIGDATSAAEIDHMRASSMDRFERARVLYRKLIDELSRHSVETLTALERVTLRHAHFYEADCLFEMSRYAESLKLYEESASLYKDSATALSAYVQIINCHVFMGEKEEARSALARARILVDTIPENAFMRSISPQGRTDWEQYFTWLEEAELF
ncbi:MAG: tetratricopeptide repeat protein [Phycisphaerae bacterium]